MPHEIERTLKQVGPALHTFLKHLSGGIAAALIVLFASNAQPDTGQATVMRWEQVRGPSGVKLKQISVGSASAIWVLDTSGYPWKWNGSSWEKKAGTVSAISAASDGTLWATSPDVTRVLKLDVVNNKWASNIPTGMKQITAVNATTVWGLDNAGTLFKLNSTTWEKKLGTVSQISVGSDGTLWATNPADSQRVLRWDSGKWNPNLPTGMVYVSVGSANHIWALDAAGHVFTWRGSAWKKRPGVMRNIAAAGDGTVWGINAQGSVYKWGPYNNTATAPANTATAPANTATAPANTATAPAAPTVLASQCSTGSLSCCNTVELADNAIVQQLLNLLGIALDPDFKGLVGLSCSPVSVLGIGETSCAAQPVCCINNNFSGLIAIDCTPVNLNL